MSEKKLYSASKHELISCHWSYSELPAETRYLWFPDVLGNMKYQWHQMD